jgi:FkbM family methyltransferase
MMAARNLVEHLAASYRNTAIDWEALLEANYVALLSGRSGLGVIDIGAHKGRHALAIKRRLAPSHLLMFEPLPEQRAMLEGLFLHDPRAKVYGCALGNTCGTAEFVVKTGAPEESGLRQRSFYNDGKCDDLKRITVPVSPLDAIAIPFKIDFIKIDVEGGEIDILKGAKRLLQRDSPIIAVEYGPGSYDAYGHGPGDLYDLAKTMNYALFDLFGNRFASRDEWLSCVGRFYWDYLMIPVAAASERQW